MTTTSTLDSRLVPNVQYVTPVNGSIVRANNSGDLTILINPSESLLSLTLNLNDSPNNGDVIRIGSSQIVTTLSMTGGTIIGALTSLAVSTFASYMYSSDSGSWFRIG